MVKFAIVGIGRMGGTHADNLVRGRIKNAELIAVCDTDSAVLAKFEKKHPNIKTFSNHKELISAIKPDVIVVATPHYFHIPIVLDCLEAGINVLSEKPMAVTVDDARRAIEATKKYPNVKYGIMFNQRTNRMYAYAHKLMEQNALGDIKRVTLTITDWYRSQYYYNMGDWRASWWGEGGGLLINQCVHQLDILQWLTGMPQSLIAWADTVNRDISVENDVVALLKYPNGAKGVFTAVGHELHGSNLLEIAGDKGKITITPAKLTYLKFNKSEKEVNSTTNKGYGNTGYKKITMSYGVINRLRELIRHGQQANILENFASAVANGTPLIANGIEGINALSIINAIYLSAYNENKEITFPIASGLCEDNLARLKEKESGKK